ncbi:MAG: hypothetical protein ACXWD3_18760, partial [Mycobacterium sp.]
MTRPTKSGTCYKCCAVEALCLDRIQPQGAARMEQAKRVGTVTYREADAEYFGQRQLRRHVGVWSLWALGVAAVISGDFFGWNFGLAEAGFGGLLIATVVVTVMYFGLC